MEKNPKGNNEKNTRESFSKISFGIYDICYPAWFRFIPL